MAIRVPLAGDGRSRRDLLPVSAEPAADACRADAGAHRAGRRRLAHRWLQCLGLVYKEDGDCPCPVLGAQPEGLHQGRRHRTRARGRGTGAYRCVVPRRTGDPRQEALRARQARLATAACEAGSAGILRLGRETVRGARTAAEQPLDQGAGGRTRTQGGAVALSGRPGWRDRHEVAGTCLAPFPWAGRIRCSAGPSSEPSKSALRKACW